MIVEGLCRDYIGLRFRGLGQEALAFALQSFSVLGHCSSFVVFYEHQEPPCTLALGWMVSNSR